MTLHARNQRKVPEATAKAARSAFPKGNVYMTMRDDLDIRYKDDDFADLFISVQGRPAESPGKLALVTVMQYAEGMTDRQAADAVRGRIDWKYALGLELDDAGFDFSVLSEFRDRVIAGGVERQLLDDMLGRFKERGLLKARGRQRTDSTHVLAAVRKMNRLERVGETLRATLNVLAVAAPDWLRGQVSTEWYDRYGPRFEQYRLPKSKAERKRLAEEIGRDGYHLLSAIDTDSSAQWMCEVPAVKVLRQVWEQQYDLRDGHVQWRTEKESPPSKEVIQSPYDPEARNRTKRDVNWTGYAVHLTETCDADRPHLITNVETTQATTTDVDMTDDIHRALDEKDLLPSEHFVDTGYVDAAHLVSSEQDYDLDLCGPAPPDTSWQARSQSGFDIACFAIDWDAQTVTCPCGQVSRSWRTGTQKGHAVVKVRFARQVCAQCAQRSQCTRAKHDARVLTFRAKAQHQALQDARQRQQTPQFKKRYKARAGIEGTVSQGTRAFGLRRARYIGLAKTRLQHVVTAAAMNLTRAVYWMTGVPQAHTRISHFAALAA